MTEVREIAADEMPPDDSDHVLIERTPGGKFSVNGSAAGRKSAVFFTPPPFDTEIAAVSAALAWAGENDVPTVYVRAKPGA